MRKHVSIAAATYERLKDYCDRTGRSMSSVVDEATASCGAVVEAHSSSPETSPAPISSSSSCDTAST
jgi:hypothetical protein